MAARIDVNVPDETDRRYPILIERGLLAQVGQRISEFGLEGRVGIMTNPRLAALYGETLRAALPDAHLLFMPEGEPFKTLETVQDLYNQMFDVRLDRASVVVALGGGVVGDTAGFAAATFMRGVPFVQIPTSLLAMVDSSVGGKLGVDMPQGKNLIGVFANPTHVLIDPEVLSTLPLNERRCGMAEILKHGLIADPALLDMAAKATVPGEADDELIARAVQVKVDVVQQDPYEKGVRAHLNLGHTFGHAIERVSAYDWLHGEAVGFGLVAAAYLSYELGLCDAGVPALVERVVGQAGLPTRLDGLDPEAIWAAMATDKKWQSGQSRFVLLRGLGQPTITRGVSQQQVLSVLGKLV